MLILLFIDCAVVGTSHAGTYLGRISFLNAQGGSDIDTHGEDTLWAAVTDYDTLRNSMASTTSTKYTITKILDAAAFADSDATSGLNGWTFPVNLVASANDRIAIYTHFSPGTGNKASVSGANLDTLNSWNVLAGEINPGTYDMQNPGDYNTGLCATTADKYHYADAMYYYYAGFNGGQIWTERPTYEAFGVGAGYAAAFDPIMPIHIVCTNCPGLSVANTATNISTSSLS